MGQQQSYYQQRPLNGPLFGGHYHGDFSLNRNRPDLNKALPAVSQSKTVRFGPASPAWEFYKDGLACDNTANTRYAAPHRAPSYFEQATPPPAYQGLYRTNSGRLYVQNQLGERSAS